MTIYPFKANGGRGIISSFKKPLVASQSLYSKLSISDRNQSCSITKAVTQFKNMQQSTTLTRRSIELQSQYPITKAVTAWQESNNIEDNEKICNKTSNEQKVISRFMEPFIGSESLYDNSLGRNQSNTINMTFTRELISFLPECPITEAATARLESNNTEDNEREDNVPISNPKSSDKSMKLMQWILTSQNTYGFALTVLHNFLDVCLQKPEDKNFINDSLVPRIRYTGFTISAAASVVCHLAIGILFTPFVVATLGQKESVNDMWYGYWAGVSISAIGMAAGMFGMVSGNYLIHKTMEKSIPQFKNWVGSYLLRVENRLKSMDIPQLRQEVESIKNAAEMVAIVKKLISIAKDLLPTVRVLILRPFCR